MFRSIRARAFLRRTRSRCVDVPKDLSLGGLWDTIAPRSALGVAHGGVCSIPARRTWFSFKALLKMRHFKFPVFLVAQIKWRVPWRVFGGCLRSSRGLARCRQPTNRGRIVCENLAMERVSVLPMHLLACIACKHCDCVWC